MPEVRRSFSGDGIARGILCRRLQLKGSLKGSELKGVRNLFSMFDHMFILFLVGCVMLSVILAWKDYNQTTEKGKKRFLTPLSSDPFLSFLTPFFLF